MNTEIEAMYYLLRENLLYTTRIEYNRANGAARRGVNRGDAAQPEMK